MMSMSRRGEDFREPLAIVESSMELVDKDQMMVCPYNDVHVIRAKRFQYHLIKCRKNYIGNDMVTCPFNAKHVIPRPEQRHHVKTCPDKVLIEPDTEYNTKLKAGSNYEGNISVPKYQQDRPVIRDSGEDWDEDIENDMNQYCYPPARDPIGMLTYHQTPTYVVPNSYDRLQESAASLRQPRSQPASMMPPPQHAAHPPAGPYQPPVAAQHPPSMAQTQPAPTNPQSWASIAGIGRGIQRRPDDYPALGVSTPGIGRGAAGPGAGRSVVRPPPGFGRGHRGPTIAANIYNNTTATEAS